MPIITWNESYMLGIENIDAHHEHLVKLLNDTFDALVARESGEKLEGIFKELISYTSYHFAAEEDLMAAGGYPKMEEHAHQHIEFADEINAFHRELQDGNALITVGLLTYLKDWLIKHILQTDTEFVSYELTQKMAINH